jgi:hypothetical protein
MASENGQNGFVDSRAVGQTCCCITPLSAVRLRGSWGRFEEMECDQHP